MLQYLYLAYFQHLTLIPYLHFQCGKLNLLLFCMNLLFHRRDLEYREALAAHYVKYHENKENTKADYIDLVKTMVGKDYKKEDIIDILDKIKET